MENELTDNVKINLVTTLNNTLLNTNLIACGLEVKTEEQHKNDIQVVKDEKGNALYEINIPLCKINDEQRLVGGIVYEPDITDAQGDSASEEEIGKAAHRFMLDSETLGIMHKQEAGSKARIVESYLAPASFKFGNQIIRKGTWIMVVKIFDDELWGMIKSGAITGFSMGGFCSAE
jgi:hypothetical protein